MRLCWYDNQSEALDHAGVFSAMWEEEKKGYNPFVLLTEADFLPHVDRIREYLREMAELCLKTNNGALTFEYCTRHPSTQALRSHGRDLSAGWFVLLQRRCAPEEIDFSGKPDPCNQLYEQMKVAIDEDKHDCYPEHMGIDYDAGIHLFWSRHLHDDPRRIVAGSTLGAIQSAHDRAVDDWVAEQPDDFRALLEKRCPGIAKATTWHPPSSRSRTSDSCSESTDDTSSSTKS